MRSPVPWPALSARHALLPQPAPELELVPLPVPLPLPKPKPKPKPKPVPVPTPLPTLMRNKTSKSLICRHCTLTCSAHAGLQAGIAWRARRMRLETPASPPTLSLEGRGSKARP